MTLAQMDYNFEGKKSFIHYYVQENFTQTKYALKLILSAFSKYNSKFCLISFST